MTMYLVLQAFTASLISLQVATEASMLFFIVWILPHHQHEPEADVHHLISSHPGLPEPS
jgi:hypothetical protein